MLIRSAVLSDLDGIMRVEQEAFGAVGEGAMAPRELMEQRIIRCNAVKPGWFFVAEMGGVICAYHVLQPTKIIPDNCISWEDSTDNGSLEGTYAEDGESVFGVSIASGENAPPGVATMFHHNLMLRLLESGKKRFMFCSRLPGLREAVEKRGADPETYWQLVDKDGAPQDHLLRQFYQQFGVFPCKFLRNGFLPDIESGGHGALVVVEDPLRALQLLAPLIYNAGFSFGQSSFGRVK